ncbi:MAG: TRAP transporter large permease subunit [Methylococcales bacterium]|nr:TRAP transporter large permease subunit [Methylococcales bacterium]MBT7445730.1 TRAP transporter large permease subunit [Methylococcales bacterium]
MSLIMFAVVILVLLTGFPVAYALAGTGLIFAAIGTFFGFFEPVFLGLIPNRLFGIMGGSSLTSVLVAVPLFVFMGVMLERSRVAENLLHSMALLFGQRSGGLGVAVVIVGMLLAASTGIVGATVVTMGLLSLPTMLARQYDPKIATGVICASGTLGQIIPPSIVLILLGDQISTANTNVGTTGKVVSVGDLFIGALLPGLLLVTLYIVYLLFVAKLSPSKMPSVKTQGEVIRVRTVMKNLLPPLLLIAVVLGSILLGAATPTEAASVGAVGAMLLAFSQKALNWNTLHSTMRQTLTVSSMVFLILIGANIFSLVFKGFGGDDLVEGLLTDIPGGLVMTVFVVMLVMFLLGFILDFIEITFVVVPIVAPILLSMGVDPIWLGIMIALNLQTSFLTPPFGFALFYLRGVAPASVATRDIYLGVMPFIGIQLLVMGLLAFWPQIATWLPEILG